MEYFINSMIHQMLKFFKGIISFYPEMILRPLFALKIQKIQVYQYLTLWNKRNSFLTFLLTVTDSRKRAKILADNRKSHHPIKTLK